MSKEVKNKSINKEKAIEFIINNRFKITITLIFVLILLIITPLLLVKNFPFISETDSKIQISEHISQILAALFVAVGSFVAVLQYYVTSRSEIIKIETDRITKAIDLAEYYKNDVLQPYAVLKLIYIETGILDLIKTKKNI